MPMYVKTEIQSPVTTFFRSLRHWIKLYLERKLLVCDLVNILSAILRRYRIYVTNSVARKMLEIKIVSFDKDKIDVIFEDGHLIFIDVSCAEYSAFEIDLCFKGDCVIKRIYFTEKTSKARKKC